MTATVSFSGDIQRYWYSRSKFGLLGRNAPFRNQRSQYFFGRRLHELGGNFRARDLGKYVVGALDLAVRAACETERCITDDVWRKPHIG